ncbi:ABC transporter permease subunit [Halomonas sp. ZH2S]|uniref:ABC transporter permease subunit n=1 Tax=Vreelandella zhuhanensis TaxID=2684210 RepID=A0A7X3H1F3_9GAMM|nr:ABC transporter permease [Halomonas zhuhanensis]MWJ28449.1 ABC transporter permease subunit [Halomonas zhuhanensis]
MSLKDPLPVAKGRLCWFSPNWVLLLLSTLALGAFLGLEIVSVAPNRIVSGTGYPVFSALGWPGTLLGAGLILALIGLSCMADQRHYRGAYRAMLAIVMALLGLMPFALMVAIHRLVDSDLPQARLGIGAGFWVTLFVLLLALVELRTRLALARIWSWSLLIPIGLLWWLCLSLWLEPLALMREYHSRSEQFFTAFRQHLELVGTAVGISLMLGMGLALLMRRYPGGQKAAFAVLNFLQTIPSLALFGLLLAPLAWLAANVPLAASLGISGIGWAPALVALVAYSLLPMVRNTFIALEEVSPAVIDAAHGMGMSTRQVFLQVRLPLALPVMLEGVRITTVQAIGLTTVAALIGAGGFGTFVFQGLGQAAMDMVLLGALPILLMASVADALLGAVSDFLRPGGAK